MLVYLLLNTPAKSNSEPAACFCFALIVTNFSKRKGELVLQPCDISAGGAEVRGFSPPM